MKLADNSVGEDIVEEFQLGNSSAEMVNQSTLQEELQDIFDEKVSSSIHEFEDYEDEDDSDYIVKEKSEPLHLLK